jgi:ATP-binding cassette, subfamily C, bacterial CydC
MLLEPHRRSIDAVAGRPGLAELAARSNGVDVRMRGAQVRYRPGGPLALDGLDLDLPPGRRVALVGRSGAGKSTVAAVLLRFCDPVGGSVTLGAAELCSYAADHVRTVIGGCLQDCSRRGPRAPAGTPPS